MSGSRRARKKAAVVRVGAETHSAGTGVNRQPAGTDRQRAVAAGGSDPGLTGVVDHEALNAFGRLQRRPDIRIVVRVGIEIGGVRRAGFGARRARAVRCRRPGRQLRPVVARQAVAVPPHIPPRAVGTKIPNAAITAAMARPMALNRNLRFVVIAALPFSVPRFDLSTFARPTSAGLARPCNCWAGPSVGHAWTESTSMSSGKHKKYLSRHAWTFQRPSQICARHVGPPVLPA